MTAPVKKNDRLSVYIEDLTHDGAGVAKVDGYPLFIQGGLPDEQVEVHVLKTLKNYGFAKIVKIEVPSPEQVEPACGVYANVVVANYNIYHTKVN